MYGSGKIDDVCRCQKNKMRSQKEIVKISRVGAVYLLFLAVVLLLSPFLNALVVLLLIAVAAPLFFLTSSNLVGGCKMEISINYLLIVIALLFFVVAYFVGIKNKPGCWLGLTRRVYGIKTGWPE